MLLVLFHSCHSLDVVRSVPLESLNSLNFWKDICRTSRFQRSGKVHVFYYHSSNLAAFKESVIEDWGPHTGKANKKMNQAIVTLCREYPLALVSYGKGYMIRYGCADLFNHKPRLVRNIAEQLVRFVFIYVYLLFIYISDS